MQVAKERSEQHRTFNELYKASTTAKGDQSAKTKFACVFSNKIAGKQT